MVFFIKRYLLAYGIFYIRVFTSGLILMIIGTTLLYIGIYYLGEIIILPLEKFMNPLPPPYSYYVLEEQSVQPATLDKTHVQVSTLVFKTPGYLIIRVSSEDSVFFEIVITNRKTYESYGMIITSNQYYYNVPIQKPGEYDLYIRDLGSDTSKISLRIDKYVIQETMDAVLAKWLQGLGGLIFLIGLAVIVFSPIIAAKQAEAVYLTPEKIREQLARSGVLRRYRVEESD